MKYNTLIEKSTSTSARVYYRLMTVVLSEKNNTSALIDRCPGLNYFTEVDSTSRINNVELVWKNVLLNKYFL